jgi:hypothetical protein
VNARTIERKLRTIEGLQEVEVVPAHAVMTPYFDIKGKVHLYGEVYVFATQIDMRQFLSSMDVAKLGASILAAFQGAEKKLGEQRAG